MLQPKLTYTFKFDRTNHSNVEKFIINNRLSEFAFLIPHETSKEIYVLGLVQGERNMQKVINKFEQIELN